MSRIINLRKRMVKTLQTHPNFAPRNLGEQKPEEEIKSGQKITKESGSRISWEASSFYYNPQKRYLSVAITALLLGALALLMFRHNALNSIFLILSSLVLILYSNQKPVTSKITINQSGILVDDIMYYYKDLKSFWIDYNPGGAKELSIESAKWYLPYVKILLNNQNPLEVRSLVINFLPEKEHENSFVDYIGRKLGL